MQADNLLLDSDLLFQKVEGNVQHTLLIKWSSCSFVKWVGMILSLFSFDVLFCMCNVYISTSEEPTWFESLPEAGNQTKSFPFCQVMDSFTWGKMKYFKGKGHPLSASQTDSNRSTSRVIADNRYSKETVPLATHPKTRDIISLSCDTQIDPSLTSAGLMKDLLTLE